MKTASLLLLCASLLLAATPRSITVVYTNDLRGELLASPDWTVPGEPKPVLGGLDRLAAVIAHEREVGACVVVDAGDFCAGSPEANNSGGLLPLKLLGRLGYDAICVGERDIPYLVRQPNDFARFARFRLLGEPVLGARVQVDMILTVPSILREIGGVKVGIIGLLDDDLIQRADDDTWPLSSGLPLATKLDREVKALRSRDAELIIVLAHTTVARCRQLAASQPDVTLFIAGHEGLIVEPHETDRLPLVMSAGRRGQRVGICRIFLDSAGPKVLRARNRVLNLLPDKTRSDSLLRDSLEQRRMPGFDDSLAVSTMELLPDPGSSPNVGDWVAANLPADGAVILPNSVLDAALFRGVVTRRSLARIVPWDEPLVKVRLTTAELAVVLSEALALDAPHRPVTAGVEYDIARPDSANPGLPVRAVNVRTPSPKSPTEVLLTRALAIRAGLPRSSYQPVKETAAELLARSVTQRGVVTPTARASAAPVTPAKSDKVNINTATEAELQKLPGIGPSYARRIIEYRRQHGAFGSIEDLMKVKGIKEAKFEKLRAKVTI